MDTAGNNIALHEVGGWFGWWVVGGVPVFVDRAAEVHLELASKDFLHALGVGTLWIIKMMAVTATVGGFITRTKVLRTVGVYQKVWYNGHALLVERVWQAFGAFAHKDAHINRLAISSIKMRRTPP